MPVPFDPHLPFQDYAHPEHLVTASWLSARLGLPGLRVVESDEDALLYDIGHIPGAMRIDWQKDLNDSVERDFLNGEAFAQLMREKGISRDDTIVVYGDKSNWWAAYTFWVFKLFGHPDVRLLDGGRDAWMAEERDTSFAVPELPKTNYPVVERVDAPLRAFHAEVFAASQSDAATLIDVRAHDSFLGAGSGVETSKSALRHGHIPGAINRQWDLSVNANNTFRTREQIAAAYADLDPVRATVSYCLVGAQAAHTWFVLKYLLGFENVRVYDGSWSEWGNMVRMPIATGE